MAGDKMRCPVCESREVGIIGEGRYFCWNCQVEFNNAAEVYTITMEGNLSKTAANGR
ncbi:MAG: TFIIB-type zinc finger domain-containing protein [Clostridiales bacterium]